MVQINFALKEVNCKIVYYGPGMSGKTTNLEKIHEKTPKNNAGELTSIATEGDRTLFFDFMPLDLGTIAGMKTKFQIYTVPGQVYYNSTRKIVLQGADGVIFVADSQRDKLAENRESLKNLEENLAEYGMTMKDIPIVLQWNKQDLPEVMTPEELDKELNSWEFVSLPASAFTGDGVFPTLKKMSQLVIARLNQEHGRGKGGLKKRPRAAGEEKKGGAATESRGASAVKAQRKLSASEILRQKMREKKSGAAAAATASGGAAAAQEGGGTAVTTPPQAGEQEEAKAAEKQGKPAPEARATAPAPDEGKPATGAAQAEQKAQEKPARKGRPESRAAQAAAQALRQRMKDKGKTRETPAGRGSPAGSPAGSQAGPPTEPPASGGVGERAKPSAPAARPPQAVVTQNRDLLPYALVAGAIVVAAIIFAVAWVLKG